MTLIKICGITSLDDAVAAAELGADYIGFLFYKKSTKRYIQPEKAAEISRQVRGVKKVALFVDEHPVEAMTIAGDVGVDVLQFHGTESPEYCRMFTEYWEVWKAIRLKDSSSLDLMLSYKGIVEGFVLDKYVEGVPGGTGQTADWDLARKAAGYGMFTMLGGGLNPGNVAEAMRKVHPDGVDVSSGVEETKGKKSYQKMKDFIERARLVA